MSALKWHGGSLRINGSVNFFHICPRFSLLISHVFSCKSSPLVGSGSGSGSGSGGGGGIFVTT